MAKERLTLYDRYGNVIEYDISSASVTIDAEGKSLDIKLSEIATALLQAVTSVTFNGTPYNRENGKINIGDQMQADWNESSASYPTFIKNKPNVVTGVKMGANGAVNTPSNGVVTLPEPGSQATFDNAMSSTSENGVQNKVIKAYVDNLINGLINGAPAALDTLNELSSALGNDSNFAATITNALAAKANSSDIYTKAEVDDKVANAGKVKSVSVNGGAPAQPDAQGNVNINVQAGGLTKDDISVETQGDGTVDINVKDDTYKINLNHTHEGMAKLVKCTEATLPDELADDTIYVQVDDASNPTEIESLYLFGLEFTGGSSVPGVPTLTSPSNGSAINVGTNTGTGVTKTLRVKGRNLTQALTVSISGTGFSVDVNSISAADANQGIDIVITYNGTNADASGTLLISSTSEVNVQCDLSASYSMPDTVYTAEQAKAAFQDSTLNDKWLKANASAVGSAPTYQSELTQGCYILKIPLAGVKILRYPMFYSSSDFGSVICDANDIVVWSYSAKTGQMNTVDVEHIAGASYALVQLYNGVTNYTIELSGNLYYGIANDKAMAGSGEVTAVGYSTTNPYPFVNGHTYKIAAGFTQSPSGTLYGILFGTTLYSVDGNQDGNGLMSFTANINTNYGKVTLKTSELDNFYILDETDNLYLFKGENVQ